MRLARIVADGLLVLGASDPAAARRDTAASGIAAGTVARHRAGYDLNKFHEA
ncbi:MAG: hypothetical protein OXG35_05210 [Acidobacteria bacterium]|nr:hypothetical protein [Acidobacteriota bacterium]